MTSQMWDRVSKRLTTTGVKKLQTSKVGVIGLGSLGSMTTLMLAMSGVGRFVLIDSDILEEHNVVRHAGDLGYVGEHKVEVVKDLILRRNTDAEVFTIKDDARKQIQVLSDSDLVIVAGLGSEITQSQLGEMLRKLGKPTIFGGLYPKAVAGEVIFVDPDNGPCYSCFASLLRDSGPEIPTAVVNYGLPLDEVKAEPGLGIHVIRVATTLADWTLRLLINDLKVLKPYPGNLVIVTNEEYEIGTDGEGNPVVYPPASSWWTTVAKDPECRICGIKEPGAEVSIDDLLD